LSLEIVHQPVGGSKAGNRALNELRHVLPLRGPSGGPERENRAGQRGLGAGRGAGLPQSLQRHAAVARESLGARTGRWSSSRTPDSSDSTLPAPRASARKTTRVRGFYLVCDHEQIIKKTNHIRFILLETCAVVGEGSRGVIIKMGKLSKLGSTSTSINQSRAENEEEVPRGCCKKKKRTENTEGLNRSLLSEENNSKP
jgi:hypothetical protein